MAGRYAQYTKVPVSRSKAQIEDVLQRYGATSFQSGWGDGLEMIEFQIKATRIRMVLQSAVWDDGTPNEKQHRQQWRAMLLVIKAKLEAVASEISTLEEEFLAWAVAPNGKTLGEMLLPQLEAMSAGKAPKLLTVG